jgi:hypothetical protein
MKVDLHSHSTNSDWYNSPNEIIQCNIEEWTGIMSITDHDFVTIKELYTINRNADDPLVVVPWVEISTRDEKTWWCFHLLYYTKQYTWELDDILRNTLRYKQQQRQKKTWTLDYPAIETIWEIRKKTGAILSIAHPNHSWLEPNDGAINILNTFVEKWANAIEINTEATLERVEFILEFQKRHRDVILTIWSDNHCKGLWDLWTQNPYLEALQVNEIWKKFLEKLWVI